MKAALGASTDTLLGQDSIPYPWSEISLTGARMKPVLVAPIPDEKSSPLIPILIGVAGAGVATYFIVQDDGDDDNCAFVANVQSSSATCGQSNGSVTVQVSPIAEYTYQWSNGSTSQNLQNVAPGSYSVTVSRTGTSCTQSSSITVGNTDPNFDATITTQNADCGQLNGRATVSVNPPGFYTYQWSNGSTQQNQTTLAAGSYSLTVSAGGSCVESYTVQISENPFSVQISLTPIPSDCGQANGSISASVNPPGTYDYFWSDGQSGAQASGLSPGSYTLTVSVPGTNCIQTESATVDESQPNFTVSVSSTPSGCGLSDGTATVTVNPPGSYEYAWSNGQTGTQITGVSAGSYTVTVTIAGSECSRQTSVTVDELPAAFTVSISTTPAGCGLTDGTATATVNPPGNYEYAWSNGQSGSQLSGLASGSYSLTVTVAGSSCSQITNTTVDELPPAFTVSVSTTPAGCGLNDGTATATVNPPGNYNYAWSNGQTGNQLSGVNSGSYTVTVTLTGSNCSQETTATIDELPPPFTVSISTTPAGCGLNDGTATATVNPPGNYNYAWSNGQSGNQLPGIAAGDYTLTVTIAGTNCSVETNTTVPELPPSFTLSFTSSPAGCGMNNGSAAVTVNPPGSYSYLWSNGSTGSQITNVSSGDYSVTVSISGTMCSATGSVEVDQTGGGFTATFSVDNANCGVSNGSATITVSPPSEYTYVWSNQQTGATLEQVAPGTYSVTATDINACSETFSVTIGEDPAEYINIINTVPGNCNGGGNIGFTITTPGMGPLDIEITGPGGTTTTTVGPGVYNLSSFITVVPGDYSFTVTDQQIGPQCSETVSASVADITPPIDLLDDFYSTEGIQPVEENALDNDEGLNIQMTQVDNEIGGTVTFTPNGDFVFIAEIGFFGDASFIYTVTDACGNTATAYVDIFVEELPCDIDVDFESIPASCGLEDGSLTVIVVQPGDYEFEWDNGDDGPTIQNIPSGPYTVTITDLNSGCTLESTTFLDAIPEDYIDDIEIIQPTCETGGDIQFTAISPAGNQLILSITHPNGFAEFDIDAGFIRVSDYVTTVPGDYSIEISDPDAGAGCFENFSATLNPPSNLQIVVVEVFPPSEPTAMDGSAFVEVIQPGQFPYAVYVNGTFAFTVNQNNFFLLGLGVGSYTVQVVDIQGCESNIEQFQVPFPDDGFSFGVGIVQGGPAYANNEKPGIYPEEKIWRSIVTGSYKYFAGNWQQEIRLLYATPVKSIQHGYLKGYVDLEFLTRLEKFKWAGFDVSLQGGIGGHYASGEQGVPHSSAPPAYWLGRLSADYSIMKQIHWQGGLTLRGWEKLEPIQWEMSLVMPFYTWKKSGNGLGEL